MTLFWWPGFPIDSRKIRVSIAVRIITGAGFGGRPNYPVFFHLLLLLLYSFIIMEKSEFKIRLNEIVTATNNAFNGVVFESVANWFGTPVNAFQYAATSERCMERQLEDLKGDERKTTFMSDLSLGEWCGMKGALDTVKNAVSSWKDDEVYMAEFVLCVNWKAWEHDARGNSNWVRFWSFVFEHVRDLMYDYYSGDDEKTRYLWEYLD